MSTAVLILFLMPLGIIAWVIAVLILIAVVGLVSNILEKTKADEKKDRS